MYPDSYYLFESLSSARSCYFKTEEEIDLFKKLWKRYLSEYLETHKMYLSSEGYQILLKIKSKSILVKRYKKKFRRKRKEIKSRYVEEPWRIVSEQIRIFHSVYVKAVNKIRGREGVLVKRSYERYYFEGLEELESYRNKMENGCERIESQKNERYRVSERWVELVRWWLLRGGEWMAGAVDAGFTDHVVHKLIETTISNHSP